MNFLHVHPGLDRADPTTAHHITRRAFAGARAIDGTGTDDDRILAAFASRTRMGNAKSAARAAARLHRTFANKALAFQSLDLPAGPVIHGMYWTTREGGLAINHTTLYLSRGHTGSVLANIGTQCRIAAHAVQRFIMRDSITPDAQAILRAAHHAGCLVDDLITSGWREEGPYAVPVEGGLVAVVDRARTVITFLRHDRLGPRRRAAIAGLAVPYGVNWLDGPRRLTREESRQLAATAAVLRETRATAEEGE